MALEFSNYNIMNFRHFSDSKSIFSKQNSNIAFIRNITNSIFLFPGRQTEQESPLFLATPHNTKALQGSEVTLDCAANGNPMPEILWLKDGESIDLNHLDSRLVAPLFIMEERSEIRYQ